MIDILIPAFLLSTVLLVIHSYFGLQIIKRNIIFTDLSVGQMAAVGVAISIFFFNGKYSYIISLSFALLTASAIAYLTKKEKEYIEAFIGLIYALGISIVFIIMSKSPQGLEELNNLLAYDILFVNYSEISKVAVLYSFIGLVLFLNQKYNQKYLKDFIFFITFAITVTSSVKLAGVFVVFSLLIAPTLISLKLFKKNHVIFAVLIGLFINLIAIFVSYNFDLPTGYTIVMFQALGAISMIIFKIR